MRLFWYHVRYALCLWPFVPVITIAEAWAYPFDDADDEVSYMDD